MIGAGPAPQTVQQFVGYTGHLLLLPVVTLASILVVILAVRVLLRQVRRAVRDYPYPVIDRQSEFYGYFGEDQGLPCAHRKACPTCELERWERNWATWWYTEDGDWNADFHGPEYWPRDAPVGLHLHPEGV